MKFVALVYLAACAAAAQEPVNIRVDVSLVNVGFSVRDAAGSLVTDLSRDEVEVLDDGQSRRISFFARSTDVPLNLGLIMDLSGSQQSFLKPHLRDLQAFLKAALRPQDRAYLMAFANRLSLVCDYTNSAQVLVDSLRQFQRSKSPGEYPVVGPREPRVLGTAFYDAVYYGSTQMMQNVERGRRALLLFSDGEDNSSAHNMMDTIEAAQANDVIIFPIRYTESHRGDLNARNKYGISVMERMARETGGIEFDGRSGDLADAFGQIGETLRRGYELAYHADNDPEDHSFHKITIRIKRRGVTVRAKTGYYSR